MGGHAVCMCVQAFLYYVTKPVICGCMYVTCNGISFPGRKCALMAISDACKFLDNGGEVAVSIYTDNLVSETESTINSQLLLLPAHDI